MDNFKNSYGYDYLHILLFHFKEMKLGQYHEKGMFNPMFSFLKLRFMPEEKPNVVWGELSYDLVKYKFSIKAA